MDYYGELLLEKSKVFVYKIPPDILSEPGKFKASKWDINNPNLCGKIRIHAAGSSCLVLLQDKNGIVYGRSVIDEMPGKTFAPVVDSSRYFTLDFEDLEGKRGLIGIGFSSRVDSTEVKEVITDYFVGACSNANKRKHEEPNIPWNNLAKKAKSSTSHEKTRNKSIFYVNYFVNIPTSSTNQSHNISPSIQADGLQTKPSDGSSCEMCQHLDGKEILNMRHLCAESIWSCGGCQENFTLEFLVIHISQGTHPKKESDGSKTLKWKCGRCTQGFRKRAKLVTHAYKDHVLQNQKNLENGKVIDGNKEDFDVIDLTQDTEIGEDRDSETDPTAIAKEGDSPNKLICQNSNTSDVINLAEREQFTSLKDVQTYNEVLISSAIQANYAQHLHPFSCGLCNITFADKSHIAQHLLFAHSIYYWKCGRCKKVFDSVDKIRNHYFSHVNLFTCPMELLANPWPWRVSDNQTWLQKCCNQIFLTDFMWKEHYLTSHTKPDDFQCVQCSEKFGNPTRLSTHVMKHLLNIASRKIQNRRKRIKAAREVTSKKKLNSDKGPTNIPKDSTSVGTDCQVTNLGDVKEGRTDDGKDDSRMETDQKYEIEQENQTDTTNQLDANKDKTIFKTEPIETNNRADNLLGTELQNNNTEQIKTNNSADNLLGTELQDKHTEQVSVKTESNDETHGETTIKIESSDADQLEFIVKVLQEVSQGETLIKIEFQNEETQETVPIKIGPRKDNQGEIPRAELQSDNVVIKNEPADKNNSPNLQMKIN